MNSYIALLIGAVSASNLKSYVDCETAVDADPNTLEENKYSTFHLTDNTDIFSWFEPKKCTTDTTGSNCYDWAN